MAHRHKVQARAEGGRTVYSGAGSNVAKEARSEKETFRFGGKAVKRAHGGLAKGRADRRARGGSVFSSAGFGGSKGHAGAPNAGKASKRAAGGAVKAKAKRHGGECEREEDGEEEEDGHRRGGVAHYPPGMHYVGGKGRRRH